MTNYINREKKSHLLKNYYSSKIEKEPCRFVNHGHLNGVVLDAGKGFLLALANRKTRIKIKFYLSIIKRVRLVLK
jgi:hypothetical protein